MEIQPVGMPPLNFEAAREPLTEEQKSELEEILAKYDPENLSKDDMKAIRDEMKAAGIPLGRETVQIMKEAGFMPPQPGGNAWGPGGIKAQAAEQLNSGILQLLDQLKSGEISEDDFLTLIGQLIQEGLSANGNVIDTSV